MRNEVHLNLDGAWERGVLGIEEVDLRRWGPQLRYSALPADIEKFSVELRNFSAPYVLLGSGDFHHLTALIVRQLPTPVTVVAFDNHPDWARRPRWGCGSWVHRALESGKAEQISIWGCGNFELRFPYRLLTDHTSLHSGRLAIYAWAERYDAATLRYYTAIARQNWQENFELFCNRLSGKTVYITIDLDCLKGQEAVTNWESGLFTVSELSWAVNRLRKRAHVAGGNICGAYSQPAYSRWTQEIAARFDHPAEPSFRIDEIQSINRAAIEVLWPALTGGGRHGE